MMATVVEIVSLRQRLGDIEIGMQLLLEARSLLARALQRSVSLTGRVLYIVRKVRLRLSE